MKHSLTLKKTKEIVSNILEKIKEVFFFYAKLFSKCLLVFLVFKIHHL